MGLAASMVLALCGGGCGDDDTRRLESRLDQLQARITRLDERVEPLVRLKEDVARLEGRVAAAETRLASLPTGPQEPGAASGPGVAGRRPRRFPEFGLLRERRRRRMEIERRFADDPTSPERQKALAELRAWFRERRVGERATGEAPGGEVQPGGE